MKKNGHKEERIVRAAGSCEARIVEGHYRDKFGLSPGMAQAITGTRLSKQGAGWFKRIGQPAFSTPLRGTCDNSQSRGWHDDERA